MVGFRRGVFFIHIHYCIDGGNITMFSFQAEVTTITAIGLFLRQHILCFERHQLKRPATMLSFVKCHNCTPLRLFLGLLQCKLSQCKTSKTY